MKSSPLLAQFKSIAKTLTRPTFIKKGIKLGVIAGIGFSMGLGSITMWNNIQNADPTFTQTIKQIDIQTLRECLTQDANFTAHVKAKKLIAAKDENADIAWNSFGNTEKSFTQQVQKIWGQIPQAYHSLLHINNFKLAATDLTTRALPHLKDTPPIPNESDPRTSYDQSEGVCTYAPTYVISVAAQFKEINSDKINPSTSISHTVLHETGHAVDLCLGKLIGNENISASSAFIAAYSADIALNKESVPPYFLRKDEQTGRNETFAEIFYDIMHEKIGPQNIQKSAEKPYDFNLSLLFPQTTRLMRVMLSHYENAYEQSPQSVTTFCENEGKHLASLGSLIQSIETLKKNDPQTQGAALSDLKKCMSESIIHSPDHTINTVSNYLFFGSLDKTKNKWTLAKDITAKTMINLLAENTDETLTPAIARFSLNALTEPKADAETKTTAAAILCKTNPAHIENTVSNFFVCLNLLEEKNDTLSPQSATALSNAAKYLGTIIQHKNPDNLTHILELEYSGFTDGRFNGKENPVLLGVLTKLAPQGFVAKQTQNKMTGLESARPATSNPYGSPFNKTAEY